MKAYVLRNNELGLMWSWEAEGQPSSEAPAAVSSVPGEQAPNASASTVEALPPTPPQSETGAMEAALGALNSAIGTKQEPDATGTVAPRPIATPTPAPSREPQTLEDWVEAAVAAIGGAVRQQEEELTELREQLGRSEIETKSCLAQIQALQSRVDTLDKQVHELPKPPDRVENTAEPPFAPLGKPESRAEEAAANRSVPKEPEAAAPKPTEPTPSGDPLPKTASRRGLLWRRLTWVVVALGIPSAAGWWAFTQGGMIDAFRDPDPAPILKVPPPAPPEAPKLTETVAPATGVPSVSVSVSAKEETWLDVETDDKKVFAKVLGAKQTKSFDASRQIKLLTGNLAGTEISYNGKQIGPLGNRHSVGAFLFTPQGWKEAPAHALAQRKTASRQQ